MKERTILMNAPYSSAFQDLLSLDLGKLDKKKAIDGCDIHVCLVATAQQDEDMLEFRRLELSKELTARFREKVGAFLTNYGKTWLSGGSAIYPYQGDSKPEEHEIEYVDLALAQYTFIKQQILPLEPYQQMLSFQPDEKTFVKNLRFYVIIVQPVNKPQETFYFYRAYNLRQLLRQSRFFGAMLRAENEYDLINDSALLFDDNIDCINHGDDLFVLKKDNFHQIFRFFEELEKSVNVAITHIQTQLTQIRVAVDGYDNFVNDCKKNRLKMAMLNTIAKKPYLKDLTPAKIQRVVDRLDKNVIGEEFRAAFTKEQKLVYDAKHPWVLLKLLGDSYLWSEMTSVGYDVSGKREL